MRELVGLAELDLPSFLPGEVPPPSNGGLRCVYTPDGELMGGPEVLGEALRRRQEDPDGLFLKAELAIEGGHLTVHTTYLGLNHQWGEGMPALFWETMISTSRGDWLDCQWRYATRAAAYSGHEKVCAFVESPLYPQQPSRRRRI